MFGIGQILSLSRNFSMIVYIAVLKMTGETGKPRAPASDEERAFASSFPKAWKVSAGSW